MGNLPLIRAHLALNMSALHFHLPLSTNNFRSVTANHFQNMSAPPIPVLGLSNPPRPLNLPLISPLTLALILLS